MAQWPSGPYVVKRFLVEGPCTRHSWHYWTELLKRRQVLHSAHWSLRRMDRKRRLLASTLLQLADPLDRGLPPLFANTATNYPPTLLLKAFGSILAKWPLSTMHLLDGRPGGWRYYTYCDACYHTEKRRTMPKRIKASRKIAVLHCNALQRSTCKAHSQEFP